METAVRPIFVAVDSAVNVGDVVDDVTAYLGPDGEVFDLDVGRLGNVASDCEDGRVLGSVVNGACEVSEGYVA